MSDATITKRKPAASSSSEVFVRGINYIDNYGKPRTLGYRGDIENLLINADESGHFRLEFQGVVVDEGVIKEVFYSASSYPRKTKEIPIPWQIFAEGGRPRKLESRTSYYIPEKK